MSECALKVLSRRNPSKLALSRGFRQSAILTAVGASRWRFPNTRACARLVFKLDTIGICPVIGADKKRRVGDRTTRSAHYGRGLRGKGGCGRSADGAAGVPPASEIPLCSGRRCGIRSSLHSRPPTRRHFGAACSRLGDGAMQMNNMAELITVAKYWRDWTDHRWILCVLNNEDLNQVTWEQGIINGDPKFEASQQISNVSYSRFAEMIGCALRGSSGRWRQLWRDIAASAGSLSISVAARCELCCPGTRHCDQRCPGCGMLAAAGGA